MKWQFLTHLGVKIQMRLEFFTAKNSQFWHRNWNWPFFKLFKICTFWNFDTLCGTYLHLRFKIQSIQKFVKMRWFCAVRLLYTLNSREKVQEETFFVKMYLQEVFTFYAYASLLWDFYRTKRRLVYYFAVTLMHQFHLIDIKNI